MERRLRWALQAARGGVWDWNLESGEAWWSPEMYALWGIESGTRMRLNTALTSVHPDDRNDVLSAIRAATDRGRPFLCEFRIRHATQGVRWMRARGEVVRDDAGAAARLIGLTTDITESRQARAALAESEGRFRKVFENAAVGIAITDRDGRLEQFNEAYRDLLGYSAAELEGMHFSDLVHPDDLAVNADRFARLKAGGLPHFEIENRYLHKHGHAVWVRKFLSVLPDGDGQPAHVIALVVDITDRLSAQEALRESAGRLRAIVDTAAEAVITIDEFGMIRAMNPAGERIFGYAAQEVSGRNISLLVPGHSYPMHAADLESYGRDTVRRFYGAARELSGRRKDGSVFPLDLSVAEWRDANGQRYFTGIMRDISQRKQAEEALRKFSRVIEQTASAVIITDTEGVIEYVNPDFAEMTGYSAEEAIGCRPNLMKSGHTPAGRYEELWRTIKQGDIWRGEFCNRRKDGTLYWESAIISPIRNADGEITHFAAIKEDVTGRKQNEETLARAQRLEAVGQLAGAVAHDFNNLLSVIIANLELIELRIGDEAVRRMMRRALEAAETGVSFNRRLLALTSKQTLDPEPLDLNDRIEQAGALLERTLGEKVVFSLDLARDLWPARADPGGVDGAILNLAMNARDAMPDGGQLVISTRNVTLYKRSAELGQSAEPGDYIMLTVSDNGQGMPPGVREHAFEPFFTTKTESRGSGLGLSSVFSFARQSGGFVTLESELGKGTTVHLYLPRLAKEADTGCASAEPAEERPVGHGEKILLVEDDARVREAARQRLELLGYAVVEAANGSEAVALLEADDEIALVLTDVVMPGAMSGYDVADWTLTHKPSVGVLLTSAHDFDEPSENIRKAVHRQMKLQKPYRLDVLARSIHDILRKR